jgi:hypothetical protein
VPRVAPTSRLAGPLRSQDRPWIGRGDPSADGLRVFVGRIHERQCMRHPRDAPPARVVPATALL